MVFSQQSKGQGALAPVAETGFLGEDNTPGDTSKMVHMGPGNYGFFPVHFLPFFAYCLFSFYKGKYFHFISNKRLSFFLIRCPPQFLHNGLALRQFRLNIMNIGYNLGSLIVFWLF